MLSSFLYSSLCFILNISSVRIITVQKKFWFIQDIYDILLQNEVNPKFANALAFLIAFSILVILIWLLNIVIKKTSSLFEKRENPNRTIQIYCILVDQKFFKRLLNFIGILIVLLISRNLFTGFSSVWTQAAITLIHILTIVWALLVLYAVLNSWEKFFRLHPKTQLKSLKGYIQIIKIILVVIAIIYIISIITEEKTSNLFVGFGATAAFITLVFKDTILGFIASIQLSFQDMIRPGDWIEVPSKNADGVIVDININSVKVQNWDNSVTMIPIYAMITDSFTNWRRMEMGPGRLFVRTFNIDVKSVKFADKALLTFLSENSITSTSYSEFLELAQISSPGQTLTNLALFRAYLELFLRQHPEINDKLMLFVRYMNEVISDSGIGLEIYAFSRQKSADGYDIIHRTVVEHVLSCASLFNISFFQKPSGEDLQNFRKYSE